MDRPTLSAFRQANRATAALGASLAQDLVVQGQSNLASVLKAYESAAITRLTLNGNDFNDTDLERLPASLRELSLVNSISCPRRIHTGLEQHLSRLPKLESIQLKGLSFSSQSFPRLPATLRELTLTHCEEIPRRELTQLSSLPKLASFTMHCCSFDCSDYSSDSDSEDAIDPWEVLAQVLAANSTMVKLDLDFHEIGDATAQILANHPSVTELQLNSNSIGDAGAQALARNTTITTLGLGHNRIGDAGAQAFARNTTLTSLDLFGNHIGDAGAEGLAANSSIASLSMRFNKIGDRGAQALARNATIVSLNLSDNCIGHRGAQALARNTTIVSLNLSKNCIGDRGALDLASNASLASLHVCLNHIGADGLRALATREPSFTELHMHLNPGLAPQARGRRG